MPGTKNPKTVNKPHFHGHRARLKERFRAGGATALADYELLELLLTYALPRKDVKPIAKNLLVKYKTLSSLLGTSADKLAKEGGLGDSSATFLKLVEGVAVQYRKEGAVKKDVLANRMALLDYLHTKMAGLAREEFRVIYLDSKNHILADKMLFTGTINASAVYPREVIKIALDKGATGLILAHNHPSGNPKPSKADADLTAQIASLSISLGIVVHDHLIIGDNAHYSFAEHGKL